MAKKIKGTTTKALDWSRLGEARVVQENQKLLIQARDRVRKYNKKYGTNYKVNLPSGAKLTDPTLHNILEQITTKNIKKIEADKTPSSALNIIPAYSINGVVLSREEYKQMQALQRKANRLRGKNFDGRDYYKPYFNTYAGYQRYMARLEKVSTMEGYLSGIARGLQTFKASILDHLDDLRTITTNTDKLKELNEVYDYVHDVLNTYSRLDKLYKWFKANNYTGEQIARLFFDSEPSRNQWELGEDEDIIRLIKEFKKQHKWTKGLAENRLGDLEKTLPIDM